MDMDIDKLYLKKEEKFLESSFNKVSWQLQNA